MASSIDTLTCCPVCDALYDMAEHEHDQEARCRRCGYQLALGRGEAMARVLALAASSAILMVVVVFAPFMQLETSGLGNVVSVYEVALAFHGALMVPLALAVLLFSIVLPWARLGLLLYALSPSVMGKSPLRGAPQALRWAFWLKPWAMAEIFMIGVAVALVKLVDIATLHFGAAFWAFACVVILNAYKDSEMCRTTLWTAVSRP